jgi:hypothetical protein
VNRQQARRQQAQLIEPLQRSAAVLSLELGYFGSGFMDMNMDGNVRVVRQPTDPFQRRR